MAKPAICLNKACGREIKDGWTLCRPCAVAHVAGVPVYVAACDRFRPDSNLTCGECGFALELHPGAGSRGMPVTIG